MLAISLLISSFAISTLHARSMTVTNSCPYTIWPAIFTSFGTVPSQPTGWAAATGSSVTFAVEEGWDGRIWGRTSCDFSSGSILPSTCLTGGCNGGELCASVGGTGVPPASLAEFNIGSAGGADWYDLSLVDGFNLPIAITNDKGCVSPECQADLNTGCPAQLSVHDASGQVEGCSSACDANLSGDPSNSPNCCNGSFDTPATCPSSGVEFYSYFKNGCPDAYAYAYDESSGSSLWTCQSNLAADYTVTFCP